ncbi:MAG: hypothetical protein E5X64_07295 [Mesorhizobium sp.]|nr:MAG: hypothetical protein E5X64_07295 [Mesorhizobium sp.]TIU16488.1 MAG: hypothetical protein E5W49_22155 [Mesorhizobium sp.]
MIHATHLHGSPAKNGGPVPESSRRRGFFAAVAASLSAVRLTKPAADEKPACVALALMVQPEIRLLDEP